MALTRIDRRHLLLGSSAVAGSIALGRPTQAQAAEIVVGNWGGDWHTRINRIFEQPFEAEAKVKITHDFGNGPDRRTKLLAQRNLPRGTMDVAHLTDIDAYQMETAGILEQLDYSKLPNATHIYSKFRSPFYIPYVVAAFVIVYNPEKIQEKPTSFDDLMNPKYEGRVGIVDQTFNQYIMAAALAAGGSLTNTDPGYPRLLELKKAVKPRIYPSHEQTGAAMKTGEIWITMNYVARALQWRQAGTPIETVYPKEGTAVSSFGAGIPKRAPNKELAYRYLGRFLDPKAAGEMCMDSFYAPAIDNAVISDDLRDQIDFPRRHMNELNVVDYAYAGDNNSRWLDWWNKQFKA